jgi:asparagine synthase (glutamine-hydrolysing)
MSGIAIVANADGQPVDRQLVAAMAEILRVRGPDAQTIWTDGGPLALVHALFQTTEDEVPRPQPFSFDGVNWITADARIDARNELIDRLHGHGRIIERTASDAELILHAWHVWGSHCVEHLLGDFAFCIVDTSRRRVFAARDPLGVKPLFYARVGDGLVITNHLDCARLPPGVSDTLDDSWVCDFLLFGWNTDVTATVFRDIRRLPGGHRLEWSPGSIKVERYWSLSIPDEVWLKHPQDYVECFQQVFAQAVTDRLRTKQVSVALSGGLDSTAIAATAVRWARTQAPDTMFRGFTCVWDPVLPNDQERQFATEAARFLDVPIEFIEGREHTFFGANWDSVATQTPEPSQRGCLINLTMVRLARTHSRVLLYGEGGDEALRPHPTYYPQLLAERRYGRWFADVYRYLAWQKRLPPVGLRSYLRSLLGFAPATTHLDQWEFPRGIADDLVREFDLRDRWERFWNGHRGYSRTPGGHRTVASYLLANALDQHDVSALRGPVEYRFPWLDLRVLNTCWSFPPPIRIAKHLVRRAFTAQLPRSVLCRRKAALAGDPLLATARNWDSSWDQHWRLAPGVLRYVNTNPLAELNRSGMDSYSAWLQCRPLELSTWLEHRLPICRIERTTSASLKNNPGSSVNTALHG